MQILSNAKYIESRTKLGRIATLVGLAFTVVSVVLFVLNLSSVRSEIFMAAMVFMTLGLFASTTGSYYAERFAGNLVYHEKVQAAVKGLEEQYTLLVYRLPVPFVLVDPGGLTVIQVKAQGGVVRYADGRWANKRRFNFIMQLGGQESVGNPARQAEEDAQRLRRWLAKRLPEGVDVPVRSVILFINPGVQLSAEDSPVAALRSDKLKGWLRGPGRRSALPKETRAQLAEALGLTDSVED